MEEGAGVGWEATTPSFDNGNQNFAQENIITIKILHLEEGEGGCWVPLLEEGAGVGNGITIHHTHDRII